MAMNEEQDPDLRDFQLPLKKVKSSTTPPEGRFKVPTRNEEMVVISKGYVPCNTQKNTDWAMRVFTEWRAEWNLRDPGNYCLEDLVEKPDVGKLNYWLCRFVTEVRKKDGQPYPPKTIQH